MDGRLIVNQAGLFLAGMGAALLLGNLRRDVQARVGLAIVLGGAAIVVYNEPGHAAGDLVFTPVLFGIGWLVGFALRERTEQTEAAEERAARAEREREAAARVAVAEERGRIARELHDVVAHAVSVMVLQVGAVRHRMPETDTRGPGGPQERRAGGPHRARGDAPPAQRDAPRRRRARARCRTRASTTSTRSWTTCGRRGWPCACRSTGSPSRCRPASTCRRTASCRRGSPTPSSTPRASQAEVDVRYGAAELRLEVRDDGPGGAVRPTAVSATGWSASASGSRSTAGTCRRVASGAGGFVLRARLPLDGGGS